MSKTEGLKVTSAEEFAELVQPIIEAERQAKAGELVKLPKTGGVVRLRPADAEGDALTGGLPMGLVAAMQDQPAGEGADVDLSPEQQKENARFVLFLQQTVIENCLEPRIGPDAAGRACFLSGKTGQPTARVHKDDFLFMFRWITGQIGNDGLEKFRNRKERRALAAQSRRKVLRGAAERDGGNKASAGA